MVSIKYKRGENKMVESYKMKRARKGRREKAIRRRANLSIARRMIAEGEKILAHPSRKVPKVVSFRKKPPRRYY